VIVIEDLHWIDSVSEELLGKIVDSESKLKLVGSTALSARMDPEDLREVISACVAQSVQRFGGFVAKYMGDGVLVDSSDDNGSWVVAQTVNTRQIAR
jgi:hypothetical protein